MNKPKPPLNRIIREGTVGECKLCNSSLQTKWFGLIKTEYCIQPECENYYDGKQAQRDSQLGKIL